MSGDEATAPSRGGPGQDTAARAGRRVGIVSFWLMAAYVVGASALSVIPVLYWPEHAPVPRAAGVTRCADEISTLEHDLLARAGAHLARPNRQEFSRWLSGWDARLLALSGGCGPLDDARRDLEHLRNDIERLVRDYDHHQAPIRDRIERLLSSYQETTSS